MMSPGHSPHPQDRRLTYGRNIQKYAEMVSGMHNLAPLNPVDEHGQRQLP